MTVRSNTYAIRAGANQFASAADGMRQIATRVQQIAATLSEKWQGQAENSFHKLAESIQSDMQTASDAFERSYSALDTLANQLDQANALYQQADQIGSQIQSLEWSHAGADEQSRASISSEIAQLSYRRSSLEYEAQSIEYQANSVATAVFNDLASMVNRLHFYHGTQSSTLDNSSALAKVGHFFNGLWQSAKQEFEKVQNTVEEELHKVNEFAVENPVLGIQIGFAEGFLESCWDAIKASWSTTLMVMGLEPQKEIELAKGIFQAVTHPVQTVDNLKDGVKVLFSTVGQSFDDEVMLGNAYTASKWFGYATGVTAQVLATDGEGGAVYASRTVELAQKIPRMAKAIGGKLVKTADESDQALKWYSLTDKEARIWYLEQEKLIPSQIDTSKPLEDQAKQAFALRNKYRTEARMLMANQEEAYRLYWMEPNLTWENAVQKAIAKGYTGDEVYQYILESSTRSRQSVNAMLGLKQ